MQCCASCGGTVPDNVLFCGYCGSTFNPVMNRRMPVSDYPTAGLPAYASTTVSEPRLSTTATEKQSHLIRTTLSDCPTSILPAADAPIMLSDAVTPTVITRGQDYMPVGDGYGMVEQEPVADTDYEEWQRRARLVGAASVGILVDDELASFGHAPMAQGTPLLNGAPMVQGTPAISAPFSYALPGQGAWGYVPPSTSSSMVPPDPSRQSFSSERATPSWGLPPAPRPASAASHKKRHHHRAGGRRALLKGVFISTASLLILATCIGILLIAFPPTLSLNGVLSGSAVVASGESLHIHGSSFVPLNTVDLTLDKGVPLSRVGRGANGEALYGVVRVPHMHDKLAGPTLGLYAFSLIQADQSKNLGAPVTVGIDGTFDVMVAVSTQWLLGPHAIHAREKVTGRDAVLSFRVVAMQPMLHVSCTTLDFGKLQVGSKATLPIVISNAGPQPLSWMADVGGAKWLKLQSSLGKIEAGGLEQVLNVTVDASHLTPAAYTAALHITSSGGNALVNVVVTVVPSTGKLQAVLSVTPSTLSFGTLAVGQQSTLLLGVANVGVKSLNWSATTGGANWLSIDTTAGTIQSGGMPQAIHITVDTISLMAQHYAATLQINSNGGSASVGVTLVVTGITSTSGTPTPTPTPKPLPTLIVSPSGFNANTDCSYNLGQGWTCMATLSNLKGAQTSLNWSVTSLGVNGVTLMPSSGSLFPGQTIHVSIFVPNTVCPANTDFTFTGPGNAQDVLWSCAAPQLAASPTTLGNGCVSCVVTLSLVQGAQGDANWSASSPGLAGVTFFPSQGVLVAGQPLQVIITVPDTVCPPNAKFAFQGPANTAHVTWTCIPAKLTVKPTNLNFGTLQAGKTGTLAVRVGNSGGRSLNWNADTGRTGWLTLSNTSSTLAPGGSTTLKVTANTANLAPGGYSAAVNITSNGGNVSLVVTLTVAAPPAALKVNPTSLSFSAAQGTTTSSTQAVTVSNVGGQSLVWTAQTDGSSWLSIDNTGSTVTPGSSATMHVTVNPTGLNAGSYSATVHIASNGGSIQVMIALTVTLAPPVLAVTPTSLTFNNISQGTTSTQTLNVSDSGGQPLTWTAQTDGASWLSIDNTGSTINGGGSATMHVTVDTVNLTAGQTYTATITVNSNGGGPVQIPIQLTVAIPQLSQLCNLPSSLSFGQIQDGSTKTLALTFRHGSIWADCA